LLYELIDMYTTKSCSYGVTPWHCSHAIGRSRWTADAVARRRRSDWRGRVSAACAASSRADRSTTAAFIAVGGNCYKLDGL